MFHAYFGCVQVLSSAECEQLIAEVETIVDPRKPHRGRGLLYELHYNQSGDPNNVLAHILGHWRLSAGLHDLAFHPGLACRTSQLFGGRGVRFWHDQLFIKPARHGGNVAWHQDYSYWTRTVVRKAFCFGSGSPLAPYWQYGLPISG